MSSSFGRYEVRRLLGEGGFGQVFLAHDPVLGRDVAVKVPRDEWWAGEGVLTEARALARLAHPAIVAVLDAGRAVDGRAYIVLEHVAGTDLETVVEKPGFTGLPPERVLGLLAGPAAALDHAHEQGILHRDIKPANLLVPQEVASVLGRGSSPLPARGVVKVADFGLHALAERHGPTPTPAAAGDPRYAAPEAWRGRPDGRSDVFSLAAVAFHLVAGRAPLPGENPAEQLQAAGDGARLRLAEVRPGLSRALDEAFAAALSSRRHERAGSGRELIARLDDALRRNVERELLVRDARQRIAARGSRRGRTCAGCREPLHPRADACPRCGERTS